MNIKNKHTLLLKNKNIKRKELIDYFHSIKYYPVNSKRWSIPNLKNCIYKSDEQFIKTLTASVDSILKIRQEKNESKN